VPVLWLAKRPFTWAFLYIRSTLAILSEIRLDLRSEAMLRKEMIMASSDKAIKVSSCPIKLEVCYSSCFWRKGDRCVFRSKRGRLIVRMKRKRH
jgi:hypothetical protein